MSIKTQKALMFIPIVNYFLMLYFVFVARKKLQISNRDFLKCACKILLFTALVTIPRIVIDIYFDNETLTLALYYASAYVYPLIIAYFSIECQQCYIDEQNEKINSIIQYKQTTTMNTSKKNDAYKIKKTLRLLSVVPFLNIIVAIYCIIKLIFDKRISLRNISYIVGICFIMTIIRASIDVATKGGLEYKIAVPISFYVQISLIINIVI